MLYVLQRNPEYTAISPDILKRLRLKHGFQYRNRTLATQEAAWEVAREVVLQHLQSGQSARYGITYAHSISQMTARCFISRDQVAALTRELDLVGVEARTAKIHCQ